MADRLIDRNPDILGGTPVFSGTRVPVRILMEHLEAGDRLDEFLDDYPTVTRETRLSNCLSEPRRHWWAHAVAGTDAPCRRSDRCSLWRSRTPNLPGFPIRFAAPWTRPRDFGRKGP